MRIVFLFTEFESDVLKCSYKKPEVKYLEVMQLLVKSINTVYICLYFILYSPT